jgi:hypothetical protein
VFATSVLSPGPCTLLDATHIRLGEMMCVVLHAPFGRWFPG